MPYPINSFDIFLLPLWTTRAKILLVATSLQTRKREVVLCGFYFEGGGVIFFFAIRSVLRRVHLHSPRDEGTPVKNSTAELRSTMADRTCVDRTGRMQQILGP